MSIRDRQARLRNLAEQIAIGAPLDEEEKEFLSTALIEIANGEDAELALDVKAKRGERKGEHAQNTKIQLAYYKPWIATAIAPENEGGLGYTVQDAVAKIKSIATNLPAEDTIARYWRSYKRDGGGQIFGLKAD